ncbi:MAG: tetrahydrofolate dehydrogenase/cyclohydrolase catalytic domain-containing protein, partial [Acidobacteriota bacterium]
MTARIIDGRKIAQQIKDEVRLGVEKLRATAGIQPGLTAILVGDQPASQVYIRMKTRACQEVGIRSTTIQIEKNTSTEEVLRQIEQLNRDDQTDGIL